AAVDLLRQAGRHEVLELLPQSQFQRHPGNHLVEIVPASLPMSSVNPGKHPVSALGACTLPLRASQCRDVPLFHLPLFFEICTLKTFSLCQMISSWLSRQQNNTLCLNKTHTEKFVISKCLPLTFTAHP